MPTCNSVTLNENIILLRHDVLNLLDYLNTPRIELDWWWKELDHRLATIELWHRELQPGERLDV